MSNLPKGRDDSRMVVIRAEPQVYDKTGRKWLTEMKSPAVVLLAQVGKDGKVSGVTPAA